jgi:hypothetical protein
MTGTNINKAFLARAIDRCNGNGKYDGLSIEDMFCVALDKYIAAAGVLAWDDDRGLFWVEHPVDGWQVAVWRMPVATMFTGRADG